MKKSESIYDLPDSDLQGAFKASHDFVLERLKRPGSTYSSLAEEIGVGVSALKQFVRRGMQDKHAPINRGRAFDAIYAFMTSRASQKELQNFEDPSDRLKAMTYEPLLRMLKVKPQSMKGAEEKVFSHKFLSIRLSTIEGYVVISEIYFKKVGQRDDLPIYEFYHYYRDGDGSEKKSDGITFVLHKSIYLFGDIQKGEGIDSIIISEPVGVSDFIVGFINSIDEQHRPFFSKLVLFNLDRLEEYIGRFNEENGSDDDVSIEDFLGLMSKEELKECPVIGNERLAINVLNQLAIEERDTALPIERRFPLSLK